MAKFLNVTTFPCRALRQGVQLHCVQLCRYPVPGCPSPREEAPSARRGGAPTLPFLQPLLAVAGFACSGPFIQVEPLPLCWLLPLGRAPSGSLPAVTCPCLTLHGCVVFHCVDGPRFIYPRIHRGTFGVFPPLAVVENVLQTVVCKLLTEHLLPVIWGLCLRVELLGQVVILCFA